MRTVSLTGLSMKVVKESALKSWIEKEKYKGV